MIHIISRRRASNRFVISTSKTVFSEWRGRSTCAAVSDTPKPQKGPKKVSRDERRAMVVSFVNKYREEHAGKFPSFSDAHKNAGGSYYCVRKIIQELEYESKTSTSKGKENLLLKELTKESECLTEVENLSAREVQVDMQTPCDQHVIAGNDVEAANNHEKYLQVEGGWQTSENVILDEVVKAATPDRQSDRAAIQNNQLENGKALRAGLSYDFKVEEAQNSHSNFVVVDSDLPKREIYDWCPEKPAGYTLEKTQSGNSHLFASEDYVEKRIDKNVSDPYLEKAEGDPLEHPASEDILDTGGPKQKEKSTEEDEYTKDISSRQSNDREPPTKPTLWGNLKSFADGLINIWRKM